MGKYTKDQTDAYNDILEAGTLATISRALSSYDETEGEDTITTIQTDSVAVVRLPASTSLAQQFENQIIEGYKKGKVRFFYVGTVDLTFELEAGDLLFFKSKVWELAGATALDPDGEAPIIYIIAARRSNLSALPEVTPNVVVTLAGVSAINTTYFQQPTSHNGEYWYLSIDGLYAIRAETSMSPPSWEIIEVATGNQFYRHASTIELPKTDWEVSPTYGVAPAPELEY